MLRFFRYISLHVFLSTKPGGFLNYSGSKWLLNCTVYHMHNAWKFKPSAEKLISLSDSVECKVC